MNVILQTGVTPGWASPLARPWPLLPVGNRPWIEFWIEWCVAQNMRDLQVVLGDGAYEIEQYLGDGKRWGVDIRYSFLLDAGDPDAFLRRDPGRWKGGLLYVRRAVFPRRVGGHPPAPLSAGSYASRRSDGLDVLYSRDPSVVQALLDGRAPPADPFPPEVLAPHPLESLQQYFDLNMAMVDGEIAHYLTPGYRRQDRAYLGYNVIFPPAAALIPPLMIGNDVRLQALCSVGPRAVLGSRVIVDRQAELADTIVLDGTYIGARTELKGRIVSGRRLIDPADGTFLDLDDTQLLAPLRAAGAAGEKVRRLAHRLLALLLLVGVAPVAAPGLVLGMLLGGRVGRRAVLGVRGACRIETWVPGRRGRGWLSRLSLDRWPLLARVAMGQLWLCGQLPVGANEEEEARSWPTYRPAAFTYADARPDADDPVMRRIDAAYYAHHRGWGEDLRILWRSWWGRLAGRDRRADEIEVSP